MRSGTGWRRRRCTTVLRRTGQARGTLREGALDRLVALIVLVLLAPLLLVIATALVCDGGRVFVRQERVGAHGRHFHTLAFRTADTRVGPLLRRYSLVDLPQLLNVLGGSMLLVGPRPPLAGEVASAAVQRVLVKPGLTGLPGLGAAALTWDDVAAIELNYAANRTLALDARILGRSLQSALHGDEAA